MQLWVSFDSFKVMVYGYDQLVTIKDNVLNAAETNGNYLVSQMSIRVRVREYFNSLSVGDTFIDMVV